MYALFKLQEPMLFRGSMEFSPNVRGPKTIATSLILPTPSTIAGALGNLLPRNSEDLTFRKLPDGKGMSLKS
jgi:CRISPR-associated protein Cmr3